MLPEERRILPGDALQVVCDYKTQSVRQNITVVSQITKKSETKVKSACRIETVPLRKTPDRKKYKLMAFSVTKIKKGLLP